MKEVKIVWFEHKSRTTEGNQTKTSDGKIADAEVQISAMLNDGWAIVGSGGAGAGGANPGSSFMEFHGFVVLQRG
jgi:hypothetical protein